MFCAIRCASRIVRPALSHPRNYATAASSSSASTNSIQAALNRSTSLFKTYKPVTPGLRHLKRPLAPHIYPGRPVRALTVARRKKGGRNNSGHITVRHRGGGHRQRIRTVDFRRDVEGVFDVARIEYDPGRSAHIALVKSRDPKATGTKKWSYILATDGLRAGDVVQSFRRGIPEGFIPGFKTLQAASADQDATAAYPEPVDQANMEEAVPGVQPTEENTQESLAAGLLRTLTIKPGNVLPLRLIPVGTQIHNICLKPDGPGILVRSAGSSGQVMDNKPNERYVHVKLQSGEVRKILRDCCATIGQVSNTLWKQRSLGKAGRARWLGIRPSVRGVAMNANDHPHGGGRGKSKSNKHPVSIWGWGTKGTRTRKPGPKGPKNSNKMVVRERPRGTEKRAN